MDFKSGDCRVEEPTTNHSRDFAPYLEKYKAAQIVPMSEDKNQKDFFGNFIP